MVWRGVGWWLVLCVVVTAAVNLLLVTRVPQPRHTNSNTHSIIPSSHHRTSARSITSHQKVYLKGEVYALRDSEYHRQHQRNRSGLAPFLSSLYTHLRAVRIQYSHRSPILRTLVYSLWTDLTKRGVTDDPWDLARKWATTRSLVPRSASGLGDILGALTTAPVIAADIGYKGTQLKATLTLKGGQRAVFKPQWFSRSEVIEGEVYSGADRHTGEIAAFHLSRLLGFLTVPLTSARRISLKQQILPVATHKLSETIFTRRGGHVCFYGVCHYCHKDASVCDNGQGLEGSVSLWLPKHLPLAHIPHPWARTYNNTKLAQWEEDPHYCRTVLRHVLYRDRTSPRLLDLMDAAVFDFLIQNGDRHHYTVISGKQQSALILIDNGKSFGDAEVDHMDILAPLLQCCRLRQVTYERLEALSGGGLSWAMNELLSTTPLAPILTASHLAALDRRLLHILAAMAACKERRGGWHRVLF